MKNVDTAIVWDAIANNITDSVDTIDIPKDKNVISKVVVGLLSDSKNKAAAQEFIDFLTGESGKKILEENGYSTEVR
jgi:molybdate transport system substrate-binding protein